MSGRFGRNVRRLRVTRGYSLRSFARQVGYCAPMISQIETGKLWPSARMLPTLARVLDASIDDLFEGVR